MTTLHQHGRDPVTLPQSIDPSRVPRVVEHIEACRRHLDSAQRSIAVSDWRLAVADLCLAMHAAADAVWALGGA